MLLFTALASKGYSCLREGMLSILFILYTTCLLLALVNAAFNSSNLIGFDI